MSIFGFGMAHKVQVRHYRRAKALLDGCGRPYCLNVSTATHEGTRLDGEFAVAYEDISAIFNRQTQFLGYLADPAIATVLSQASLRVAFFDEGVRANNTTVLGAMAAGCPVLTNLDEWSPAGFIHGDTVLDIAQCTTIYFHSADDLEELGVRGRRLVEERYSWPKLIAMLGQAMNPIGITGST